MDQQTPTTSIPTPSATATAAAAAAATTITTTTTTTTSQSTEPSPAQPPQQKLAAALPPSTTSQPPPSIPSSSSAPSPTSVPNPNPNPNSNQPVRPIISTSLSQPQSQSHTATRPQTFARTTWNHPHPHSHFSHFSPISSPSPSLPASSAPPLSSSASPSISAPQQRGGVAIGVPAPHPSPSPAAFSSSFGQPFGGLSRTTVNVPESVANTNNLQLRQGMQGMGMVGSMSSASHIRPGGIPAHHQQRPVPSSIRPPTSSPNNQSPTAQNFQGHGFMRPSSVVPSGSPAPNTSQNMQSPSQPWLASGSQSKPPLSSSSYRSQINSPSLQQRSHIPQQHHSLPATSQQQHMSSAQPQQPLPSHQPPEHYGQQFPPSRVPRSITQQLALQGPANLKPSSLAMVQPNTVQPGTQSKTANAESDESGNRILSKRSIHELVSQIDPSEKLDPEVEDILVDIADEFVESITTFGCSLAKHRKSDTLEAKDILLHLERNWNMTLPGFSGDEIKTYRKPLTSDIHKERLAVIKKSILASEMGNVKSSVGQAAGNSKSNLTKTPANAIVPPNLKTREVT